MASIEQERRQSLQAAEDITNIHRGRPKYAKSKEAYYDKDTDTVFAPDSTGEFYHHEMFHARPDTALLNALRPYYENLNDERIAMMGGDVQFVKRIDGDPGHFYSPEEVGARIAAASKMLKAAGVQSIDGTFLKNARSNETQYGDNFRDLLRMYNDENLLKIFQLISY